MTTEKGHRLQPIYQPLNTFMVRMPLWSLGEYKNLATSNGIERLFRNQDKYEAILSASPTLARALDTPPNATSSAKQTQQLRDSLTRYLIRMSTRPTPFGAFAGVGLGEADSGSNTAVTLDTSQPYKPIARLDIQYLLGIVKSLEELSEVRHQLNLYANSALHTSGGRLYIPVTDAYGQGTSDQTASVRFTPTLKAVLDLASAPVPWQQLLESLREGAPQTSYETIVEYLDTLWQQGLLLSTLRPPLTLLDPLSWVLDRLRDTDYRGEHYQKLAKLERMLCSYNEQALGAGISLLNDLYEETGYSQGSQQTTVEVDTGLQLEQARLSSAVLDDVARAAHVLLRVSTAHPSSQVLRSYRSNFLEQYGEREIPVLELLDEETGLGPPNGYRNPPPSRAQTPAPSPNFAQRDNLLLRIAGEALHSHQREVVLDDELITQLEVNSDWKRTAPESADLFTFVAAKDQESIESGDFSVVVGPRVGTQPAGRSLGRYCHVVPDKLNTWLKSRAGEEEANSPDILFADLVYSHLRGHATNVAIRPPLYTHQIAINTTASVDATCVIPLNDVLVGVRGGRFYLKSGIHGKRIVLRSMHLLNFMGAPNVCRFLQEVSEDGVSRPIPFNWGNASQLPYLPRLRHGRIVLSIARWHLPKHILSEAGAYWPQAFSKWRERWNVPRSVYLSQSDNRLLLDLERPEHLELLKTDLDKARAHTIILEEALPGSDDAWVQDNQGNAYMSEFIVPLERKRVEESASVSSESTVALSDTPNATQRQPHFKLSDRLKSLGDEWLFFKLYAGKSRQDDILLALAETLKKVSEDVDLWFFLRYTDPHPHLRLRFSGDKARLMQTALVPMANDLNQLVKQRLLNKFTVDSYDRELERYGGLAGMEVSEKLFCVDSTLVLKLVAMRLQKQTDFDLNQLGVISVDYMVRGIGFDVTDRNALYQTLREGQQRMLNIDENQISREYRDVRPDLWNIFKVKDNNLNNILKGFQQEVAPLAQSLKTLDEGDRLSRNLQNIVSSHLHMHCNRLGLSPHEEFRVVYYLSRLYDGFRHYLPDGVNLSLDVMHPTLMG